MRGLPPFQALLLLVILTVLGFAGIYYIDMGQPASPQAPPPRSISHMQMVEAEIELVFSSPPLSYTLKKPSVSGDNDLLLLQSSSPVENPCYNTVKLVSSQLTAYWLDVIWPDDAKDDAHHFVQINVSPTHGKSQRFSFFSNSREMNETFEYHSGDHHHE